MVNLHIFARSALITKVLWSFGLLNSLVISDENIAQNVSPTTKIDTKLLNDSVTSVEDQLTVNGSISGNSGYADHSSPWSPNQPLPPTITQAINRPLSHCNLRPVNWINFTQGNLVLLSRQQVDELFHSTQIKHRIPLNQRLKSVSVQQLRFTKLSTHDCYLLFLYTTTCRFSVAAFPYVKALARAYPQLHVYGVRIEDYMAHRWSLRMLFVPKLKLIVDGRVLREYPGLDSDLDAMIDFVWLNTRQLPRGPVGLELTDYENNPPPPPPKTDVCLIAAWITVLFSLLYLASVFWDVATIKLMSFMYHLSRGRFGRPNSTFSLSSSSHAGPILEWFPGQITPVN